MSSELTPEERRLLFPINPEFEFERAVFRLTRLLKHNRKLIPTQERHIIKAASESWLADAVRVYPNRQIGDLLYLVDSQWIDAHWPLGGNPLEEAVMLSHKYPNVPARPPDTPANDHHYAITRVVYNLMTSALRNGETAFYLSSHDLSQRLDIPQSTVYRALKRLEQSGQLKIARRGVAYKSANTYLAQFWK